MATLKKRNSAAIKLLDCKKQIRTAGNKALNLCRLIQIGINVPQTYVCSWDLYTRHKDGDQSVVQKLRQELAEIIEEGEKYAIRSSSNLEDDVEFSFAGQFDSYLNISDPENVLESIIKVWSATTKSNIASYAQKHAIDESSIQMGVIIQKMVQPLVSGVALSINPITGENEIIIEAVEGLGEELVQKGATPFRWVYKHGKIFSDFNNHPNYGDMIHQIAKDTAFIAKKLHKNVDLEWVYDGIKVYFVQVRDISPLRAVKIYSNRISRDMLPGMIKPLIWSVNIPIINSVWIDILEKFTGNLHIEPQDLAKQFYYRTYFNMGIFGKIFKKLGMPDDSLEMMMGLREKNEPQARMMMGPQIIMHLPRITVFIFEHFFLARKMRRNLDKLEKQIDAFHSGLLTEEGTPDSIIHQIDSLTPIIRKIAYFNIIGPLAMSMYNHMLKRKLEKFNIDFLSFDLMKGAVQSQQFDPNVYLEQLHQQYLEIPVSMQEEIRDAKYEVFLRIKGIEPFRTSVEQFIQKFGHFSDSGNDFSYAPWREKKDIILQMICNFQKIEPICAKISFEDLDFNKFQKRRLYPTYHRAREYRILRDRVSSDYTFGYGLFRILYIALGKYLTTTGSIYAPEDVFFLTDQEVRQAISEGTKSKNLRKIVQFHKDQMSRFEGITVPERIIGDKEPLIGHEDKNILSGIPASAGHTMGKACVIRRFEDFPKMETGQVLVIPYSDVGWTPLFVKASAIIAESGGMLSHSAIIAREYGIPAIVSVSGAMNIKDGQQVTIDANNNYIYLHD